MGADIKAAHALSDHQPLSDALIGAHLPRGLGDRGAGGHDRKGRRSLSPEFSVAPHTVPVRARGSRIGRRWTACFDRPSVGAARIRPWRRAAGEQGPALRGRPARAGRRLRPVSGREYAARTSASENRNGGRTPGTPVGPRRLSPGAMTCGSRNHRQIVDSAPAARHAPRRRPRKLRLAAGQSRGPWSERTGHTRREVWGVSRSAHWSGKLRRGGRHAPSETPQPRRCPPRLRVRLPFGFRR